MESLLNSSNVFVGGLDEDVTEVILMKAFITFGEILSVQIPVDPETKKNKGFGFVQFEFTQDAEAAIDNMNHAELLGKVITVNNSSTFSQQIQQHSKQSTLQKN